MLTGNRFVFALAALLGLAPVATTTASPSAPPRGAQLPHGSLPLAFVPNAGQTDARVRFQAQAGGASFWFTPKEAVFAFAGERKGHVLRLGFQGANPRVEIEGAGKGAATVNYLRGSDPARWHAGLSTYEEVVYRELWPGIDLAFRSEAGTLKYEFRVEPGANPGAIRLAYHGAERLSLSREGDLRIDTPLGVLTDSPPVSYQLVDGERIPVESRYALAGRGYRFALGRYDRRHPLVIDPGLVYSTVLGGSGYDPAFGSDWASGIAVDSSGNAYVAGATASADFPTTAGAFDTSLDSSPDVFVTKLDPGGSTAVYSTYLGGNGTDYGFGIAVDGLGNAYVTGQTSSNNFPTTAGAFDTTANGDFDAFVTKLGPSGASLVYSTYLGGSGTRADRGFGITVDGLGNAYVTGDTASADFPTTAGAFDTTLNGFDDAFVTKVGPSGSALLYSTYLGGVGVEDGSGIAIDILGNTYVTGWTSSNDFPVTAGAFDTSLEGGADAYVTKLGPAGGAPLVYSTLLGGNSLDRGFGIAVDGLGNAYVAGDTYSTSFPTTPGAFDTILGGDEDAFVAKLGPSGGAPLLYSTYLGGGSYDAASAIAIDGAGNAYVTGIASADFPTTEGAADTTFNGFFDSFMTKLGPVGGAPLLYSTFLGGNNWEQGNGIAVHGPGNVYVAGLAESNDYPTTAGAFDTTFEGFGEGFVTKLSTTSGPATLTLSPAAATNPVGTSHTVTATVTDASGNSVEDVTVRFTVAGSVSTAGSCISDASGQCDFTYQGPDFPDADVITAYADTNGSGTQDAGEPAAEATKTWILPASTPGQVNGAGQLRGASAEKITFGLHAKSTLGGPQGSCHFHRHLPGPDDEVDCVNVSAVVIIGNMATIHGSALHNGQSTLYQITARENDEPTPDEVTITTVSGFNAGGPLEHGKVDVKN